MKIVQWIEIVVVEKRDELRNMRIDALWSLLRIALGFIFFWAFLDKLLGLNFATPHGKSWLDGVSPTAGFLEFAVKGPFTKLFNSLSGIPLIDWIFMAGLLLIGLAFILGIGQKIAGYSGAVLIFLIYITQLPLKNNPLIDEHIIYLLLFLIFSKNEVGLNFSIHKWWERTNLVKKYKILK